MSTRLDATNLSWMHASETRAVMVALTVDGGEARFVGGAVRNALLGEPVTDVDIATPLTPEEVTKRLKQAGLSAVPTGIEHGTVTAVANGKPFEVTTLRRDVTTDGRRAVVAFTSDWAQDASRRDFTINAMYASADGALFDPTGGTEDLKSGRVRFIGDATQRIREDYLRILRLFRFHAWYGKGAIDKTALAAASAEKGGLRKLSGERVQKELLKLLAARDPMPVLVEMEKAGILSEILPLNFDLHRLKNLIAIDTAPARDAILRLAVLMPSAAAAASIASSLKLSNANRDRLVAAAAAQPSDLLLQPESVTRAILYRHGKDQFRALLMLSWAENATASNRHEWNALVDLAENWQAPKFPLDGRDVIAAGAEKGPEVGKTLAALENWWIEQDFNPDRAALLARLRAIVRVKGG